MFGGFKIVFDIGELLINDFDHLTCIFIAQKEGIKKELIQDANDGKPNSTNLVLRSKELPIDDADQYRPILLS